MDSFSVCMTRFELLVLLSFLCVGLDIGIVFFLFQAEDGIRDLVRSRGLGDVYKRQHWRSRGLTEMVQEKLTVRKHRMM